MSLVVRPPREDEVPALVALMNAVPRGLYGKDDLTESELRHWFTTPTVEVERDVRVVERDGVITAYADVGDQSELHTRYWLDLHCDPERGQPDDLAALVAWAHERSRSDAQPDAIFRGYADSQDDAVREALEAAGLELIRHSYRMGIELNGQPSEPTWPDGISVRTFNEEDARAVYDVQQETFADMWEHTPDPYEEWSHWNLTWEGFDPSLWWIASEHEEIAGIALCSVREAIPETGWVNVLGVRRPWRRRGLGRALLEQAFAEFARRGFRKVGLGVDAESLTGAHRLYEQAGMRVIRRFDVFAKPL